MRALVLGGGGYVGSHLQRGTRVLTDVVLADIKPSTLAHGAFCDVREPITLSLTGSRSPEWIILLAAVHREPGHKPHEYFDTNVAGARNVATYADAVGCKRIFFMSSTSPYGPTSGPTDEQALTYPSSPYGMSKLAAELILEGWQKLGDGRRLIVCRPGVIYGPGDPGNILRMIKAIRRGYFFFPGEKRLRKSYAYIDGLIESMDFTMSLPEPFILYNYVERETETLEQLVQDVQNEFGCRRPVPSVPKSLLVGAARAAQALSGGRSSLHPVRVRKAAMPTHIVPRWLIEHDFPFRHDFRSSLRHWRSVAPEDFTEE